MTLGDATDGGGRETPPGEEPAEKPAEKIDTVVFDVGNVLIEWDPRHLYRKLLPTEAEVERVVREVVPQSWNERQDAGRSWADGVAARVAERPDDAELIRAYDARWQEMVSGAIEPSVAVLRRLKAAGVPLFAITNFSAEKWAETIERFDFFALFDGVVVSAHERVLKPDPRIYRILFERHGVDPRRAVFIDDNPDNVAASEAVGMRAVFFTRTLDLSAALAALGLPTAGEGPEDGAPPG